MSVKDYCEQSLVHEQTTSSDLVEAGCEKQGGSANTGSKEELSVENIFNREPREKLAEAMKADDTLAAARALADTTSKGYHWVEGLLFRIRLDTLGDRVEQLCQYRDKCLRLSHESFGHTG